MSNSFKGKYYGDTPEIIPKRREQIPVLNPCFFNIQT